MIGLFADLVVAALRWLSRVSPAPPPYAVVDAQPTGAGASATAGSGGHPPSRRTSELLTDAALWMAVDYPECAGGEFTDELLARAKHLAAHGD